MTFTIVDAPQRSEAWFHARLGKLTGSRASDVLATIRTGEAAARRDYRLQLVCERLTGQPQEDPYINGAMQRGIECEPLAFRSYESRTGQMVQRTGFLAHTTLMAGASLDGHVGDFDGVLELKCPKSATHLRYIRAGVMPPEHLAQVRHALWLTGAAWCDFVSYDDRFPEHLSLFVVRVPRNEIDMLAYDKVARAFLAEVDAEVQAVAGLAVA